MYISTYDADETLANEETSDTDIQPGLPERGRVISVCFVLVVIVMNPMSL